MFDISDCDRIHSTHGDAGAGEARVDMVKRFSVLRCTYKFPFIGRWVRDLHLFTRQEVQIHVPKGSIEQGGYDFS